MMSARISSILGLLFLLAAGSEGGKKLKCKKWPAIEIDDQVLIRGLRVGWYFPMMKKITLKPSEWFEEIPKDSRVWKHKECSTMTAVSSFGSMKLEVAVKYNTTRLLAGTAENKNGAVVGDVSKVSMFADINAIMADPQVKEYLLGTYCIFGREPFWVVISAKKTLSKDIQEKVLDKIEELGFSRDDVEDPNSVGMKPYKLKIHDCNAKDGGLDGASGLDAFA